MSDEITVFSHFTIRKTSSDGSTIVLQHQTQPTSFIDDVTGTKGPVPGAVTVTTLGTDINFSELVQPGYVRLMNQDSTNFVEWGIFDPQTNVFYPVGEIGPGESYVFKFSRNLLEEYAGTGTGTTGPTNTFRFKANTASCVVLVEAFER